MTLEQACSKENYDFVYLHCLYALNFDEATASDITQDVFLALTQNWKKIQHHPNLRGWLCTTADHKVADYYRKQKKNIIVASTDDADFVEPQTEYDMLFQIKCDEIIRNLDQYEAEVLDKLNEKERRLLYCVQKHMKHKEIAIEFGKSVAAVTMDISRLKHKVQSFVKDIVDKL